MTPSLLADAPHPTVEAYGRHVNPPFVRLLGVLGYGRVFVRALGTRLWDDRGREYLDFLAGFGALNLGHGHPRLVERLHRFLDEQAPNLNHVGPASHAARLAAALVERAGPPLEICLFSSSGAEAVEAGVKLACAATRRAGLVSCEGGFHGTNLGVLPLMGEERLRRPFEPLLARATRVPFGDLARLDAALSRDDVAAFVVEPVQAEGGVVLPPASYLRDAQELCRRRGTLLILDEVQTGMGRTGALFAFQREGFLPDVLVLAKSLGGGIAPIGATLVSAAAHERAYGSIDSFDLHSSTFAGNAFASAAALETLAILDEEGLCDRATRMGQRLLVGLQRRLAGHPLVREVRGRGLLVGVELGPTGADWVQRAAPGLVEGLSRRVFGQWVALRLLEEGLLCQPASQQWNVLRFEPPLTVTEAEVDRAVGAVGGVLDSYEELTPILRDVVARLADQLKSGGSFR